jgi:putative RecB family exonuclease
MATKRKPTLSPSRFTTYLACPVMYRWSYEDPRGRWFRRAKPYFSFGTTLHKVLQRFHEDGGVGTVTKEALLANYDANWIEAGYESDEESARHRELGRELLEAYFRRQVEVPTLARPVYVERMLRYDMGPFVLSGRVDRVDEHPDGRLEIVDYKSGRDSVTQEEVANDLAMCAYQLLLRRTHPDRRVFATIHALRAGHSASHELDGQDLAQFEEDLRLLGEEVLERDFLSIIPTYKEACAHCDFVSLCKKDASYLAEWTAAQPATPDGE